MINAESKLHVSTNARKWREFENPEIGHRLKIRRATGRPRIEIIQPGMMETIISIAMLGSGAHLRRREEVLRCCTILDDLHDQLQSFGYTLSGSATYLWLLSRRSNTKQGNLYVKTVPVKLVKAQTTEHKRHDDTEFCTATIRALNSLASYLGPKQACFVSQDDKCRVPLGMTICTKQGQILMHVQYRIQLPDHDWIIADRHKLIPSVYAILVIKEYGLGNKEAVTYSGPTLVIIRSGKHDSSNAASHAIDFEYMLNNDDFKNFCRTGEDLVKPVIIIETDRGPDECPRYPKVIAHSILLFRKYDLDGLFVVTNAPGRSAYNPVERRLAPLSHQTSGVILDHQFHGTHLD